MLPPGLIPLVLRTGDEALAAEMREVAEALLRGGMPKPPIALACYPLSTRAPTRTRTRARGAPRRARAAPPQRSRARERELAAFALRGA